MRPRCSSRASRPGFSLVEALTGVTITTVAGAALLTALGAAVRTSTDAMHAAVGRGLAEQLMNEIAAARFPGSSDGPSSGSTRASCDDIDDYAGWSESPPTTRRGQAVGTEGNLVLGVDLPRLFQMRPDPRFLERFTRSVFVERIVPNSNGDWAVVSQPSDFRRVTVRVTYSDARGNAATVAELTRIFSHVSPAP